MTIQEEIDKMFMECQDVMDDPDSPFNDWEYNFLQDNIKRWTGNSNLSEERFNTLKRIWEKI